METVAQRREINKQFLEKWSLEKLKTLTLEDYAIGNNQYNDTLSYWLETKTNMLGGIGGLGGGGSFKFGIYYMSNPKDYKNHSTYNSDDNYAWRRKLGNSPQEAFNKIKCWILEIAQAASQQKFSLIDDIPFPYAPLKWKLAFLYSNENLIHTYQKDALQFTARKLGMKNIGQAKTSEIYQYILQQKPADVSVFEWSDEYWTLFQGNKNINYYVIGSKYGNGGNVDVFPSFVDKRVIATNFYRSETLEHLYLKPKSSIKHFLKNKDEPSRSHSALSKFLNIKVGDKIAIKSDGSPKGNKGYLKIVGFAEVVERNGEVYTFDKTLGHCLNVNYLKTNINHELSLGGYGRTLHHLSNQDHIKSIFESDITHITQQIIEPTVSIMNYHPLNQILYGPPGTGKTFRTRELAYKIIKGLKSEDAVNHKDAIQLFKDLKGDQIEFITFHQNYSYEDFVQGLRPDVDTGEMKFKKHNGIFFNIAKRAKDNYLKSLNKSQEIEVSFEDAFNAFCEPYFENEQEIEVPMARVSFYITEITETHIKNFRKNSGGTAHDLLISKLKEIYNNTLDSSLYSLHNYYHALVNAIRKEAQKLKTQIKPEPLKNYILIIDEINRANISRVFGELITLLEPDKRFGEEEEIEVQLPSGDKFVVPPNLYLIGTMNTADKSIALLDIALRRRFNFVAVYPDASLIDERYRTLFDDLNKKIAEEKTPDFTIGHAYFMAKKGIVPELKDIMNSNVIPLLLEYFMNDINRVKKLLKSVHIKTKKVNYGILEFDEYITQKNTDEAEN